MTTGTLIPPARRRDHVWQFFRFAAVGASGVAVNLAAVVLIKRLGPHPEVALLALRPTAFHVRWYHLYSTAAFVLANLWNFQLNRHWTFRGSRGGGWWRQYWPFLAVGLLGWGLGLVLLTLLMHRSSPLSLPTGLLDDSSGLRTRLYWAQLIVIVVTTPIGFVLNKLWTFSAARVLVDDDLDDLDDEVDGVDGTLGRAVDGGTARPAARDLADGRDPGPAMGR